MKINFQGVGNISNDELVEHAIFLFEYEPFILPEGFISNGRQPPEGYEDYVCIDVLGKELQWINEQFPKEQYTWYLWFECIFLVTPEMATYLKLRWA
jgi:hypothetical protein